MTRAKSTVRGVCAPTPRLTLLGAALVASAIAVPVGGVIWLVEAMFF